MTGKVGALLRGSGYSSGGAAKAAKAAKGAKETGEKDSANPLGFYFTTETSRQAVFKTGEKPQGGAVNAKPSLRLDT